MIIETKEVYKCEYCRKLYQLKRFAVSHEVSCSKNPDNKRACYGCKFMEKKNTSVYVDHPVMGETSYVATLCHCSKKELFLYPHKVEHKGNSIDLGYELNEPMPRVCELYTEQDYQ